MLNARTQGSVPLVVEVGSADIMATLLQLKADIEDKKGTRMRMVFSGATEAHLLAEEIGKPCVKHKPVSVMEHSSQPTLKSG